MKVLVLVLGLFAIPHDFFVSILTLRHNTTTKSLDLTWRITAHDLEHALENVAALELASPNEHPKADSIINAYMHEHLHLAFAGRPLTWDFVGKELDGETLYCYLQVAKVDSLHTLTVSNTLLQDLYFEQQNLVHVEGDDIPTRSHTFIQGAAAFTFEW